MTTVIIGLHGVAGAGKSTAALSLEDSFGFSRVPFAGPLKRMAAEFGITKEEMGDLKEVPFSRELPDLCEKRARKMLIAMGVNLHDICLAADRPVDYLCGKSPAQATAKLVEWGKLFRPQWTTPRRFMQLIGTEWGRGMIGPSLWLESWKRDFDDERLLDGVRLIVADDCRFPNEAELIKSMGGIVVEIVRDGAGSESGAGHVSENRIPDRLIDITIRNDGTPDVLAARMSGILDRYFASEAI